MARAPDKRVEQAHKLYKQGLKLVEIANQLNIPSGTVRRWKSTYEWDSERSDKIANKSERSVKKKKVKKEVFDDGTKETMLNENLTHEQRLFCIYYSKSFNATQSYIKAYGCSYESAMTLGSNMLRNVKVKEEIERLQEIKRQQIVAGEDDLIEMHMRIAFADIGDYLTFGIESIPQWKKNKDGVYEKVIDPNTNEQKVNHYNVVNLKESNSVDTQLIQEVKEGKDGVSIKLIDKQKSLDWLDRYFLMNPLDKHKIDYDNKKLEFAKTKAQMDDESELTEDDGFIEALEGKVDNIWSEE